MTITVAPAVENRLRRRAARTGEDIAALAETLLLGVLSEEASDEELREEYRRLVSLELQGKLTSAHQERLRAVTDELDARDAASPAAQAMSRRLGEVGSKLDEMLAILRALPAREPQP